MESPLWLFLLDQARRHPALRQDLFFQLAARSAGGDHTGMYLSLLLCLQRAQLAAETGNGADVAQDLQEPEHVAFLHDIFRHCRQLLPQMTMAQAHVPAALAAHSVFRAGQPGVDIRRLGLPGPIVGFPALALGKLGDSTKGMMCVKVRVAPGARDSSAASPTAQNGTHLSSDTSLVDRASQRSPPTTSDASDDDAIVPTSTESLHFPTDVVDVADLVSPPTAEAEVKAEHGAALAQILGHDEAAANVLRISSDSGLREVPLSFDAPAPSAVAAAAPTTASCAQSPAPSTSSEQPTGQVQADRICRVSGNGKEEWVAR